MIDYYEELSLGRRLDTKQIQEELVRLESLWHKREVNSPEKANKMLGIIMDAQKAFASEASRKKYDNDLEASLREPEDPDVSRSKLLEKWTIQARNFFDDRQYDLAKAAIERALSYVGNSSDNRDLFHLAASIYLENDEVQSSMEYINRAIILSPEWPVYYITKAQIFEKRVQFEQHYDKRQNDINECRNNLRIAVSKAQACGDANAEGVALGMLAFSLYFHPNPDMELAEEYANRARVLGEYANSTKVLDSIAEKKNTPVYNEAQKEEGYGNLHNLHKALELYESLGDWRDASDKAAACRTRIGQLGQKAKEIREAREAQERRIQAELETQRKKKEQIFKLVKIATPIVLAVIVIIGMFVYNIRYQKCGDNLKWSYDGDAETLTITGTGCMYNAMYNYNEYTYPYQRRKWPWSSNDLYKQVKTIIIEDGCTQIGGDAFRDFRELTNIEIPDSVTDIWGSAFYGCSRLETIEIPDSVTRIGSGAFYGCSRLETIEIPDSVTRIGNGAFYGCSRLETIEIPDSVTDIGHSAFYGCSRLETIEIPYGTARISSTFKGCSSLETIKIPYSVFDIGDSAFEGCSSLETIEIPDGVRDIGSSAFKGCSSLETIEIPDSVTSIGSSAFHGCSSLETIEIPDSVTSIGDCAFSDCSSLETIEIPDSVTSIGSFAFSDCSSLETIEIPDSVTSIGSSAFYGCSEYSVIYYSGTRSQWHSLADDLGFIGSVICSDGKCLY